MSTYCVPGSTLSTLHTFVNTVLFYFYIQTTCKKGFIVSALQIRSRGSENLSNLPKVKALINRDSIQYLKTRKPALFLDGLDKNNCHLSRTGCVPSPRKALCKQNLPEQTLRAKQPLPSSFSCTGGGSQVTAPLSIQTTAFFSTMAQSHVFTLVVVTLVVAYLPSIHPSP